MNNSLQKYEIYPLPHQVDYREGVLDLDQNIHVLFDQTIDQVTRNKVEQVLTDNQLTFAIVDNISEGQLNLLVGTTGSNGPADQYLANESNQKDVDFEKIDAYQLNINDNGIVIVGKDTDASFYGVVTLERIFAQLTDKKVRNLQINDYSNTKFRGVIEGFYGIPWSNEDRISLMKFGGQFKANTFVFAPKDDPYHRERWSELYPKEMLTEIGRMAKVGNETKNRFIWTISPLGEVATLARTEGEAHVMALLEENTEKMLRKFDQLYDVGVRQFGVLGDDVGNLPLEYVVKLMASVSEWVKEKGDVYDTLYCPASYNSAWAWIPAELNAYEKGFDENIQIFWTGSTTCAPVDQDTIDVFKNKENDGVERRDPLFWMNWPVNDVDMSRVFLGKGEMYQPNIQNLAGVVTNPMQEAEASKISIFATADYTWNTEGFDDQKSWEDSMKYIEPDAAEELHVLANHMSDAHPNGIRLSESEDIKALIERITNKIDQGESIKEDADEMIKELEHIATMADQFLAKTNNKKLKEELDPFVQALRDLVLADVEFIKAKLAVENEDKAGAWHAFASGLSMRKQSNNYDRPVIVGEKKAKPSHKRLQPFTEQLQTKLSDRIADLLGVVAPTQKATIFTNVDSYQNLTVSEKENVTAIEGQKDLRLGAHEYLGVKLSRVREVLSVDVAEVKGLTLEASLNGSEWETVDKSAVNQSVRYVRLVNNGNEAVSFDLATFKVISHEVYPKSVKETNYKEIARELAVFDNDLATNTYYRGSQKKGAFVTYDLGQEIEINNLKVYVNESEYDFPRCARIEVSTDGETYTTVMEIGDQDQPNKGEETEGDRIDAIFDQLAVPRRFKEEKDLTVKARYLKFIVTRDKVGYDKWIRLYGIMINDGEYYPDLNDPTTTTSAPVIAGNEAHYINDGKLTTSFKPGNTEANHLLYHVGEVESSITGITILQDPRNVSASTVSVRTPEGWLELGELNDAYQFFDTTAIKDILDLKIEWSEGNVPTIYQVNLDRETI